MTELISTVEMTLLVLLAAILAGPILGAKFRVPGLLALIFLGMIFGPFGLGWLGRVSLVYDLGAIGIIYLMFLAGLGFNLKAFNENRTSAIGFGLFSFIFPFALSVVVGLSYLEAGILGALLLGSMWASNTLVAYPDVMAAGLEDTRAARDAMSGGVVADMLALLVLAIATSYAAREAVDTRSAGDVPTIPLFVSVPLLVLFSLWVLPRLAKWFFVRVGRSRVQKVLFSLAGMAAAAGVAVAGGIAGIIGAFLAGIGLNRLVPKNSELMDRIDFVGSTVFIPAFLVSIGLRIDPAAMVDLRTVAMGVGFLVIVIVGKGLAVLVSARMFGYSYAEGGLIVSLSIGQAASTLAVGQIGLELGLFEQRAVNASILTIVLAALLTTFGTQHFIRRLPVPTPTTAAIGERVLFDVRSSEMLPWVKFAGRIARGDGGISIPFSVAAREEKAEARQHLAAAEEVGRTAGYDSVGTLRLSESFTDGVLELVDEIDASIVLLGWSGPRPGADLFFGSEIDDVGSGSPVPTVAAHLVGEWDRVIVVPATGAVPWHGEDAALALDVARRLCGRDSTLVVISSDREPVAEIMGPKVEFEFIAARLPGDVLVGMLQPTDLVVAPAYLIPEMALPRRLRLSSRLADQNLAIVAGPGRLAIAPRSLPHAMERILGPQG